MELHSIRLPEGFDRRRTREAVLYGRYRALCDLYRWPVSDEGFKGYKKTLQGGRRNLWAKQSLPRAASR